MTERNYLFKKIFIFVLLSYLAIIFIVFLIDLIYYYIPFLSEISGFAYNIVCLFVFFFLWIAARASFFVGLGYLILLMIGIMSISAILKFFNKYIENED